MNSIMISRRALMASAAGLALSSALAQAQDAKLVIAVYAGQDEQLWDRVVAQPFSRETSIPVSIFGIPLPQVGIAQADGDPDFQAALMSYSAAYDLHSRGFLLELTEDDVPAISTIPKQLWPVGPTGAILGMPVFFGLYGIAFNTDLAKASDFESWTALVDPKWKGQVSITRPAILARQDLTLFSKLFGGSDTNLEPGYEFIGKFAANALNVYTSMASLMSSLGQGEVVAAPFFSDQIELLRKRGATNVDFVIPKEGGLVTPYLVVIPKGATHPMEAKRLVNALADAQYQIPFMQESALLPTNPAIPFTDDMKRLYGATLDDVMAQNVTADWTIVARDTEARVRRIEEVLSAAR